MKHFLSLFISTALFVTLLLGCNSYRDGPPAEENDWKSTTYNLINNIEDVTMTIKEHTITAQGLTVMLQNDSKATFIYGEDFILERLIEDNWYQVPPILDEYGFNDIGYELFPLKNEELSIEWDWLYGNLPEGEYRIIKTLLNVRKPGDFDTYYLSAEFTLN